MQRRNLCLLIPATASGALTAGAATPSGLLLMEELNKAESQHINPDVRGGVSESEMDSAELSTTLAEENLPAETQNRQHHHTVAAVCIAITLAALAVTVICVIRLRRLRQSMPAEDADAAADEVAEQGAEPEAYRPYENRSNDYDRVFLSRLDNLIAENISSHNLTVDFLAAKMLISRSLLFRRVKRITGRSIVEYINDSRIARAVELLHDDSYNLTEISELVGYSSLRYFSRVFKSATGELPSVYRQNLQDKR